MSIVTSKPAVWKCIFTLLFQICWIKCFPGTENSRRNWRVTEPHRQIANKSFRRQQRAQSYQICEQFVDRSTGKLLNNLSGKCLILMGCGRGTVGQIQSLAIFIFCQMYWKDGKKEKVAGSGPIEKNLMGDNVLNRFT